MFGEATYRFNPQWALTGGLRYYDFEEDRTLTFAGLFADQGYTDQPGSTSSDGFSPRVILAFSPNERRAVHGAGGPRLPPGRHQRPAQRQRCARPRTS